MRSSAQTTAFTKLYRSGIYKNFTVAGPSQRTLRTQRISDLDVLRVVGDQSVARIYLYRSRKSREVPANVKTLTLPDNDRVRILAITVAREGPGVFPAQPLYDTQETAAAKN